MQRRVDCESMCDGIVRNNYFSVLRATKFEIQKKKTFCKLSRTPQTLPVKSIFQELLFDGHTLGFHPETETFEPCCIMK